MKLKGIYLNVYQFACYICLLIAAMPVVNYFCNWYITLLPFLIIFFRLAKYKSTLKDSVVLMVMAVLFVIIQFWGVYRNQDFIMWMIDGVIVWLPCLIALYIRGCGNTGFIKKYLQMTVVVMTITSVTTIIGLVMYPEASRELASGTEIFDTTEYTIRNIGGYEHIYALVVLLPFILWLIKNTDRFARIVNILCMIINLYCIYKSQYTIAIVAAVAILMLLFLQKYKKVSIILFSVLAIVLLVGGTSIMDFLSNVFRVFSENIGLDYVKDRLLQVSQLLKGVAVHTETSADRIEYYQKCWELFLKKPIWGNNFSLYSDDNISGHSMILDVMSGLGLIGLGSVICIFGHSLKVLIKEKVESYSSTVVITWIAFILISILNPSGFMPIFMVIFVGSVCIQRLEKQNEGTMVM